MERYFELKLILELIGLSITMGLLAILVISKIVSKIKRRNK